MENEKIVQMMLQAVEDQSLVKAIKAVMGMYTIADAAKMMVIRELICSWYEPDKSVDPST